MLSDNKLNYWSTYNGKVFHATGPILAINGEPAGMTKDQAGKVHEIGCDIMQPAEIAKAANLSKGKSVTAISEVATGPMRTCNSRTAQLFD